MDERTEDGIVLGADMGGTHTRVVAAALSGEVRSRAESGPGNPVRVGIQVAAEHLREALFGVLENLGNPPVRACCVGMAGRSHPEAPAVVAAAFRGLPVPKRRVLVDDGSIALAAAFGDGPGILLMAGTGSGVRARGPEADVKMGGFGPLLGDEGSAHVIGVLALRAVLRADEGRIPPTCLTAAVSKQLGNASLSSIPVLLTTGRIDVPRLFLEVDRAADAGDAAALEILSDGARDLAALGAVAARRAGLSKGASAATAGGVLGKSATLRARLVELLITAGFRSADHVEDPVLGAVFLARAALAGPSGTVPPSW